MNNQSKFDDVDGKLYQPEPGITIPKRELTKKQLRIRTNRRDRPDSTTRDLRKLLKIKIKALAAEARIIRAEERKSWGMIYTRLYLHRINCVRKEARHTQLAYAYIRGHDYKDVEQTVHEFGAKIDASKIARMVDKCGHSGMKFRVEWLNNDKEKTPIWKDFTWQDRPTEYLEIPKVLRQKKQQEINLG